ncbi:MAG: hypothetical protein JWP29_4185, partial [Rhodoferax sp.]|nr:hypothetical protein [Rhodoferax sp.]
MLTGSERSDASRYSDPAESENRRVSVASEADPTQRVNAR